MKRTILLIAMLILAGCAVKAQSLKQGAEIDWVTRLPPTTLPADVAAKEVRVARDVARFHLSWLTEKPKDPSDRPYCWIVARVQAYGISISETDAASDYGNAIRYSDRFPRGVMAGSITPLIYLTVRPLTRVCDYSEIAPINIRLRGWPYSYESIDLYSPFYYSDGGTVICKVNDRLDGLERYRPADMIPPAWIDYIKPAMSMTRKNEALFQSNDTQAKRQLLTVLMNDKNPFIAVDACRRLAEADAFDPHQAADTIYQADPIRSAAILTVMVTGVQNENLRNQLVADLCANVSRAKSYDAIRGIAIGIGATAVPYGWMSNPIERIRAYDDALKPLVHGLIAKYKSFDSHHPIDDALMASLQRLSDEID